MRLSSDIEGEVQNSFRHLHVYRFFANTLSFFIRSACHFAAGIKDGRVFGPDAKTLTRHPRLSVRVKELTIGIYGMYASDVFHIVWRQNLVRSTFRQ